MPQEKQISISIEELRKRKLFVGTPMYGGMCGGQYTKSIADLSALCAKNGIDLRIYYIFNESLITRARNYIVDEFLRSDSTHLMFIDSDIGFNPQDVITMLVLATGDKDIMYGPYPKKVISWEKIVKAVNAGLADENPEVLSNYAGDFVFNPKADQLEIRLDEPVETLEGGTGFMMIQRHTFERFNEAYPELRYLPDHIRTQYWDGSREITAYFDTVIEEKSRRYLSEDYMFCQWAIKIGLKVWLCPWMRLTHMGSYLFGGSLDAMARLGVSPTADLNELKKSKK